MSQNLDKAVVIVEHASDLTAELAANYLVGTLVFVKEELAYYSIIPYSDNEGGWFKPLLEDVVTGSDLENKGFLTNDDVEDFATKESLNNYAKLIDLESRATKESLEGYATKDDVKGLATKESLEGYATKDDVKGLATETFVNTQGFLKADDVEDFASKTYVDNSGFLKADDVKDLVSKSELDSKDYATRTYVDHKVTECATKNEIKDLASKTYVDNSGFLKADDVKDLVSKSELDSKDYATRTYVDHKVTGYATKDDVKDLALKESLNDYAKRTELENLVTKEYIDNQGFLKDEDIEGLATETYVNNRGFLKADDVEDLVSKSELDSKDYATRTYVDHKVTECATKNEIKDLASKTYVDNSGFLKADDVKDLASKTYVDNSGFLKADDIKDLASKTYVDNQGFLKEHQDISHLASKTYVDNSGFLKEHQDISHLASKESLNDYVKKGEIPTLDDVITTDDLKKYAKKDDLSVVNTAVSSVQSDLIAYEKEVTETYTKKSELDNYVTITTFQNNNASIVNRLIEAEQSVEDVVENIGEIESGYVPKTELEKYKEEVESTYAKPEDISSKLNTYAPSTKYDSKWIGVEYAGDLVGKTGGELGNKYSYSEVFDQMFFADFTPTISQPEVDVELKENWNGGVINWYDKENRIVLVKAGIAGPDGRDFVPTNHKDAVISYPKNIELSNKFTNGLILSSDQKQECIGFCRVKDENGNWDYYKKNNNIYHVPSILEVGEYRYYMAAYFEKGSPALNNKGNTVATWNENTPVESKKYITINASKPTYYNNGDVYIENPLLLWGDEMTDYMVLKPSCQTDQAFKLPRRIKGLYIWNDLAGDYAKVPMVYKKNEQGLLTEILIPAYFTETVDENDYYTYIYDSLSNGHRGEIKIKVIF